MMKEITVNGCLMTAFVDTGSDYNLITEKCYSATKN